MVFQIQLKNEGQKSAKKIEVLIRASKSIFGENLNYELDGGNHKNATLFTSTTETGPMRTLSLTLESLHPDQTITLSHHNLVSQERRYLRVTLYLTRKTV